MNWIKVEDKLPEIKQNVIVALKLYRGDTVVEYGYISARSREFVSYDGYEFAGNITHWQPLPEPPKP